MSRATSLFDPPVDITDNYSTVYFIIKYTNLLLEEAVARKPKQHKITIGYNACQLQDDISNLLLSETKEIYQMTKHKTIRFVVTMEEVATCKTSFHLTTKDEYNPIFTLSPEPIMLITIKGDVTDSDTPDNLSKLELFRIYGSLLNTLTNPKTYNLSMQNILIDRIETVGAPELEQQHNLMSQKISTNSIEEQLMLTKKELERQQTKIIQLEKKHSHEILELQQQVKDWLFTDDDDPEESLTASLTTSSTRRRRRKKKTNKQTIE